MKKFKNILYDNIAKPLVKIKKKFNLNLFLQFHSFGNFNQNKIFYVIRRSPGAGMFSNVIFVMNHLLIAKQHNFIPVVDMANFPTIYSEKNKINGTYNAWEYYFEKVSKYTLKEVYKSKNVFITNNNFISGFYHKIYKNKKFNKLRNQIKIRKDIYKSVNIFKKKYFKNQKILGIHYRGTSYKTSANHPFPPTKIQMVNLIKKKLNKNSFDKIFLCTEDKSMFDYIKSVYGSKIIHFNSFRSKHDDAFKKYPRKKHRYLLGKEIIFESILLSNCNHFLFVQTNVSNFVRYFNPKIKFEIIDNGQNSSNEYVAKYLWFLKRSIPKNLGGFKNTI